MFEVIEVSDMKQTVCVKTNWIRTKVIQYIQPGEKK